MIVFEQKDWSVDLDAQDERVDKFIAEVYRDVSRSQIQKWMKDKRVFVNGKQVEGKHRLTVGDDVTLKVPPPIELNIIPEQMDLDIVYEDEVVAVINKQRGMVVHPAPGHLTGTLVNGLLYHCNSLSQINGLARPGIVHRIDKDTSGLLMVAKTDSAHLFLAEQLKEHSVKREYKALVRGVIPHDQGTIDAPIGRDIKKRQQMGVNIDHGKHAVTYFSVLERMSQHTLLKLNLETGRTHQIRVHMNYIGYPLVGDPKYGSGKKDNIVGQALHAASIGFVHPDTREYVEFNAPLPSDMEKSIEQHRQLP